MMYQRRIALEHLHNLRDLGGYPAKDGTVTKWHRLYRSDNPSFLTDEEWKVLQNLGVSLLIDLRSEQEKAKSPVVPGYPLEIQAVSLMKELDDLDGSSPQDQQSDDDPNAAADHIMKSMELDYTKTLFGNLTGAVQILDLILKNLKSGGSTMFFCSAGKDRTGITAAMVLYLCGVAREDIIADYQVSATYNEKGINRLIESVPESLISILPDKETLRKNLGSEPKTMADLLDSFESRDIRTSLSENGFGPEKQQELAGLMTEQEASHGQKS